MYFATIAPLIFADVSKKKGVAERFISKKQKQFFVFCKKDMIANKMFFQNIYKLRAFWLIWHYQHQYDVIML